MKDKRKIIFHSLWLYSGWRLNKIKMIISIEKYDDPKILIEIDDKLPDGVTLKNAVILIGAMIINFIENYF